MVGTTAVVAGLRLSVFVTGTPWLGRCDPSCDEGGYSDFSLPLAGPVGGPRDLNRSISFCILGVFQNNRTANVQRHVLGEFRVILIT